MLPNLQSVEHVLARELGHRVPWALHDVGCTETCIRNRGCWTLTKPIEGIMHLLGGSPDTIVRWMKWALLCIIRVFGPKGVRNELMAILVPKFSVSFQHRKSVSLRQIMRCGTQNSVENTATDENIPLWPEASGRRPNEAKESGETVFLLISRHNRNAICSDW
jgi:hypothetical protein